MDGEWQRFGVFQGALGDKCPENGERLTRLYTGTR